MNQIKTRSQPQRLSFINPEIQELKNSLLSTENPRRSFGAAKKHKTKKILIMGLHDTGKSSIALKFLYDFPDASNHGPEENYYTSIKFKNESFLLHIVDMAGIDEYTPLIASKYSIKVDGYIFVYSIDNKQSFEFIQNLRDKLYNLNGRNVPCVLVANKCDLKDQRQVSEEDGQRFAKGSLIPFLQVSAKKHSSEVIKKIFEVMLKEIIKDENQEQEIKCLRNWGERRIEHLYDLFRFVTKLTIFIGFFYITFGVLNLLSYPSLEEMQGVLLILMVLNGCLMISVSILGSCGLEREEKDCISIFTVLCGVCLLMNIASFVLQLAVDSPFNEDFGANPDTQLVNIGPLITLVVLVTALFMVFLLVVAFLSGEIIAKRRTAANNRFQNLRV